MLVLNASGIEVSFADRLVLRGLDLQVKQGERVGLVGPNGCGKSTLIKVLAGEMEPDNGEITLAGNAKLLRQDPDLPFETVADAAMSSIDWHRKLLDEYNTALDLDNLDMIAIVTDKLDLHGWEVEHRISGFLNRLGVPPAETAIATLSGGERRRLCLAMTLLGSPDLLLLDEPTNHLDAESILWLESYLAGFRGSLLLVTHDRYLLEAVASRIVEIEAGVSVSYAGSYADYLIARAERTSRLHEVDHRRKQMIKREAEWASRSPKARSTKQKGRLQRLDALREVESAPQTKEMSLSLSTGVRTGSTLIEGRNLGHSYDGKPLFSDVELILRPGERIGVLGPNGCGKSTLLKILMRQLEPTVGELDFARQSKIALFDQHRIGLDPNQTLTEAAGDGNDEVKVGNQWIHVTGFLRKFMFTREQLKQRVGVLSGGERARLLLAKLLLKGANVLLLDEPTNDLDLLTLRVLEEALISYDGAVVIVTHDRAFLDRVTTSILAFEPDGGVTTYADRAQYINALRRKQKSKKTMPKTPVHAPTAKKQTHSTGRLSFKENQLLTSLPQRIEELEQTVKKIEAVLADPVTYQEGSTDIASLTAQLEAAQAEIEASFEQWSELTERK